MYSCSNFIFCSLFRFDFGYCHRHSWHFYFNWNLAKAMNWYIWYSSVKIWYIYIIFVKITFIVIMIDLVRGYINFRTCSSPCSTLACTQRNGRRSIMTSFLIWRQILKFVNFLNHKISLRNIGQSELGKLPYSSRFVSRLKRHGSLKTLMGISTIFVKEL